MYALLLLSVIACPEDENLMITPVAAPVHRNYDLLGVDSTLVQPKGKVRDPGCNCGDVCNCVDCKGNCGTKSANPTCTCTNCTCVNCSCGKTAANTSLYMTAYNTATAKKTGLVVQCEGTEAEKAAAQAWATSIGYGYTEVAKGQFPAYQVGATVCDYKDDKLLIRSPIVKDSAFYTARSYSHVGVAGARNHYSPTHSEAAAHLINSHGAEVDTSNMSLEQLLQLHDSYHTGSGSGGSMRGSRRIFRGGFRCVNCN